VRDFTPKNNWERRDRGKMAAMKDGGGR